MGENELKESLKKKVMSRENYTAVGALEELRIMELTEAPNSILKNSDFRSGNWKNANLQNFDLRNTNLSSVNLKNSNLVGANLRGSIILKKDESQKNSFDLMKKKFEECRGMRGCILPHGKFYNG